MNINKFIYPLILIFIIYNVIPFFQYLIPSFIRFALFCLLALLLIIEINFKYKTQVLIFISLLAFSKLEEINNITDLMLFVDNFIVELIVFFSTIIFIRDMNLKKSKYFSRIFIFLLSITLITTIYGNFMNPGISRDLATSSSQLINFSLSNNIGGFNIIYSIPVLLPLLLMKIYSKNSFFYLLLSILCLVTIYVSEYTSAFVIGLITTLISLILMHFKSIKIKHVIILIVISVFSFQSTISSTINQLSLITQSNIMSDRLNNISMIFDNSENYYSESYEMRIWSYKISVDEIIKSPLIGNFYSTKIAGGHSFILDFVANFGILGLLLLIKIYYIIYKKFIANFRDFNFLQISFFSAIMIAIVNPTHNFFILCLISIILSINNERNESFIHNKLTNTIQN